MTGVRHDKAGGHGVRSEIDVPPAVNGERRGIPQASSARPDAFTEQDPRLRGTVSTWIAMLTHRSELFEQIAGDAVRQGRRQAAEELARITRRESVMGP